MELQKVPSEFRTEKILQLEADGSFSEWTRGKLASVDDFLSNFHKQLQRRMLFTDPADELPVFGVIKLESTGEVYLLGESREDAKNDETYDRLTVLHLASNASSGIVEYFNYHNELTDPLTADLGKRSEGEFYVAVEYLSTKTMESGDEAYQGKFVIFGPSTAPFKRDGVFNFSGKNYKVVQPFLDSGFSCAVVLQQEDDMEAVVYHKITSGTSGYDVTSGLVTLTTIDYTLPGTVDKTLQSEQGGKVFTVYLKIDPLPVDVTAGNSLTLADGSKVKIITIGKDKNTQGQTMLTCEGG